MAGIRLSKCNSGFTLIEFGVTVGIIAVLGLAADQTARLNVTLFPTTTSALPAVQRLCTVNLAIMDAHGNTLAFSTEVLQPYQSKSLNFTHPGAVDALPGALPIHAAIGVPPQQTPQQTMLCDGSMGDGSVRIAGSMELVDNLSGKTMVALPAVQLPVAGR